MEMTNVGARRSTMIHEKAAKLFATGMLGLISAVGSAPPAQLIEWVRWVFLAILMDTVYGVAASFILKENRSYRFSEMLANKLLNYMVISSVAMIVSGIVDTWMPLSLAMWALIMNEVKSMIETAIRLYKGGRYFWRLDLVLGQLAKILESSDPDGSGGGR